MPEGGMLEARDAWGVVDGCKVEDGSGRGDEERSRWLKVICCAERRGGRGQFVDPGVWSEGGGGAGAIDAF